jgi:integrase
MESGSEWEGEMESKRERGTGRLFQRGQVWWAQYYLHGQQVRTSTGETDEKKAGKFLKRKLAEVETGTHGDAGTVRYEQLRDSYMADFEVNNRKSLRRNTDGDAYVDCVVRLDAFFSGYKVSEIDADSVRKFQAEQRSKGLSNGSINRSVSALRRMFNIAKREERLREVPYFPFLKESAPRAGFVERAGYEQLLVALPDYLRPVLALGFWTGMRRAEILGLQWCQVDFISGTITLRAGETKNDDSRTIPIAASLRALLLEQRSKCPRGFAYVCFRVDRRGIARRVGNFRRVWQSRCVKLGLGKMEPVGDSQMEVRSDRPHAKPKPKLVYRGLLLHDLRRSCVRSLVRSQVPEKVAMAISGHKTRAVFDRYNIVSENDVMKAGRQLEEYFENGDKSGTAVHRNAADDLLIN